jgi:hypothetical protein
MIFESPLPRGTARNRRPRVARVGRSSRPLYWTCPLEESSTWLAGVNSSEMPGSYRTTVVRITTNNGRATQQMERLCFRALTPPFIPDTTVKTRRTTDQVVVALVVRVRVFVRNERTSRRMSVLRVIYVGSTQFQYQAVWSQTFCGVSHFVPPKFICK